MDKLEGTKRMIIEIVSEHFSEEKIRVGKNQV